MNTPLNHRLAAAFASVVVTFSLLSGVTRMADRPVPAAAMLAQADTGSTVR